ncbi:MAG TPA: autotransporter outer membrane beta-barrel domain-containing protein, partial [Geminicoccus sp.]
SAVVPAVGIGGSSGNGGAGGTVCLLSYAADSANCQQQGSDGPDGRAATVITTGDAAIGVLAQSIGGGGGNGGDATGYSGESIFNLQMGGSAGTASSGGIIDVFLRDLTVQTSGARSMGLVAHSVGGGGGNGGAASGYDGGVGYAAGLSVGGVGGGGGSGGAVTVNLESSKITTGQALASGSEDNQTTDAYGIVAQSIGGGGGNGGAATSDDIDVAVPTGEGVSLAATMAMAVGGKGGSGGSGGSVDVELSDNTGVSTFGQGSHGLIAQSIGGGGGNGGNSQALSATVGDGDTVAADVSVAVGGSGSGGGNGGSVQVAIGGQDGGDATTIQTADDYANAVLAQSIGGGGGNAGVGSSNTYKLGGAVDIDLDIGLGGTGGSGSAGGTVGIDLQPYAAITTHGSGSRGIVAQSIGGGGGASQGGTVMLGGVAGGYSGDVEVGVGRKGGGGGTGSTVTVDSYGAITTTGGDADGILAQSIGGGGGLGGSMGNDASADHQLAQEVSLIKDGESTYTFTTYVGGQGGSGANAGAVVLDTTGTIRTGGDWADGIVAQSIGGGGGVGGTATASGSLAKATTEIGVGGQGGMAGAGGNISGTVATTITTGGYSAFGLLAQSIGGGGGQGGDGSDKANATVRVGSGSGVGGSGGASGNGGSVDLTVTGTITTAGDDAHGLVLQSIGSGGGTGGAGSSAGVAEDIDVTVTVGGRGGGSGAGGAVTLEGAPAVATTGERAFGIVLQSIGGGGGIGGTSASANVASLTLGGNGGSGVDGGTVTAHLDGGHITTSGQGAHGVVLQSIGGGGGIGGDSSGTVLAMGGSGGNSVGNGGDVSYDAATSITTTGTGAFGIIAQSIGGGGGLGGSRSGALAGSTRTGSASESLTSGTVSVLATGDISASGENAIGIFAQSDAVTAGKVTVEISGAVSGGSGSQGVGIHVDEGSDNTLTIDTSGSVTAASGVAVRYTADNPGAAASLSITNNGTIDGSLDDATVVSGNPPAAAAPLAASNVLAATTLPRIRLDNRGTVAGAAVLDAQVTNGGRLVVGAARQVDATEVTGDFAQTATGRIVADLDLARSSGDRLVVRGDAELAGQVEVAAITLLPGRSAEVLTVAGTGRGRLEAADSPIFDYRLDRVGNAHVLSVAGASFEAPLVGRSMNERRIARHLQAAWDLGGTPDLAALFADLDTATQGGIESYGETLYGLTPGTAAAPAARAQAVMQDFADSLFNCPTFAGTNAVVREGSCVWAQVAGGSTDQDAADGAGGFSQDGFTYQLGMQNELAAGWYLGISAAYREDSYDGGNSRSSGDSTLAGITVKHQQGPWLLGLGLSGGYGWFDTSRTVATSDGQAIASSDPEVQNLGLRARAAYDLGGEHFYLRPALDLDAIYTRQPGYRESGAEALDLVVEASDQWGLVATPSLELGGRLDLAQGWMFRPYLRGGVSFADQSAWRSTARLAGAPDGAGSFATEVPIDEVVSRVDAGLQILNGGDVAVRVQYDGEFSDNVTSHGGSLRVDFRF